MVFFIFFEFLNFVVVLLCKVDLQKKAENFAFGTEIENEKKKERESKSTVSIKERQIFKIRSTIWSLLGINLARKKNGNGCFLQIHEL